MLRVIAAVALFMFLASISAAEPVTVLAPSYASIEVAQSRVQHKKPKTQDEVDILITLMEPAGHAGLDTGAPQFFGALYYKPDFDAARDKPQLRNLLGDVEEIRYNGKVAWGANVSVADPGLYQFIMEGKPFWNEARGVYLQEQAKVPLPVLGGASGWQSSTGQSLEILPLSRPYANVAPCLFSGRLLLDGKPLENIPVRAGCISAQKDAPEEMEAYTSAGGNFAFLLNAPGWWYCQAEIPGAPLKGPDGSMKPVERSTVFWQYVGSARN